VHVSRYRVGRPAEVDADVVAVNGDRHPYRDVRILDAVAFDLAARFIPAVRQTSYQLPASSLAIVDHLVEGHEERALAFPVGTFPRPDGRWAVGGALRPEVTEPQVWRA